MQYHFKVTGLMSGSSLDGVDLAFCEFSRELEGLGFQDCPCRNHPLSILVKRLAGKSGLLSNNEVLELDLLLGMHFADLINDFHSSHKLAPN